MFNQRRSFFKGKLFYIILLALFGFGLWLNQAPAMQDSPDEVNAGTNYPTTTDEALKQGNKGSGTSGGSYDIMDSIIGKGQTVTPAGVQKEKRPMIPKNPRTSGIISSRKWTGS